MSKLDGLCVDCKAKAWTRFGPYARCLQCARKLSRAIVGRYPALQGCGFYMAQSGRLESVEKALDVEWDGVDSIGPRRLARINEARRLYGKHVDTVSVYSVRDRIAEAVLPEVVRFIGDDDNAQEGTSRAPWLFGQDCALYAYAIADAMLAKSVKGQTNP